MARNNWIYKTFCYRCNQVFEGSEFDCDSWVAQTCPISQQSGGKTVGHAANVVPSFLPGEYRCRSCRRAYGRIKGSESTEDLCETCVMQGKSAAPQKMRTSTNLNCNVSIAQSARNLFGQPYSHVRKQFLIGGEDWACCGAKSSYDFLSGKSEYSCGKRGSVHVALPKEHRFSNGGEAAACAILCNKCAAQIMKIPGAKNLGFH